MQPIKKQPFGFPVPTGHGFEAAKIRVIIINRE
jgi:hypothetical protein